MLAKCANPSCSVLFRRLDEGTLFRLENDPALALELSDLKRPEYFWLCGCCSETVMLRLDGDAGLRVVPSPPVERTADDADFTTLDRHNGLRLARIRFS